MFASGHSPLGLAHLLLYPEGAHIMNTRWQSRAVRTEVVMPRYLNKLPAINVKQIDRPVGMCIA